MVVVTQGRHTKGWTSEWMGGRGLPEQRFEHSKGVIPQLKMDNKEGVYHA